MFISLTQPKKSVIVNVNHIHAIWPLVEGCAVQMGPDPNHRISVMESFDQVQKIVTEAFDDSRTAVFG
jgi:hypothetical protein